MSNHVHLVVYDKNQNISIAMQSLSVRYVSYFNKKYGRIGNLVQGRFFSKNIMNKVYLLNVSRYIHQNPEKAQIAHTEDYKWSSYHEFLRNPDKDGQLREIVQNLLGIENMSEIKQNYAEKRNEMIEKLQIIKGTNYNQIARVTGINRKMIERVIKGKNEKQNNICLQ